jgi:hypothetical protein
MVAIGADLLAAFSSGKARFLGRKLVSRSLLVGGCPAFAGDLTLFTLIH